MSRSFPIARALWGFPILLLLLSLHQVIVALDVRRTLKEGVPGRAEVIAFHSTNRSEISYDYVGLRVELEDGVVIEHAKLSMPHSFAPLLAGRSSVDVRVLPGARQEIVITEVDGQQIGRAHMRVAAINAAMSFLGFVLLAGAVFAWNRFLALHGDPASRSIAITPEQEALGAG
jgi:hypothetical protein